MKHFIKETDLTPREAAAVFAQAASFKKSRGRKTAPVLNQQTWALIFSKSSTRTRVSFEVGVHELGGNPLFLNKNDIQLGRGESIEHTAKVLSRYVHGLIVRTFDHADVVKLAQYSSVPVINALTDLLHPCQMYSDAFTLAERWTKRGSKNLLGSLKGKKIAFVGDTACNMANSWILGANHFDMQIALSGPEGFRPSGAFNSFIAKEGTAVGYEFTTDPFEAVKGADVVYTDVWVSMGKEEESANRTKLMAPYTVTAKLLAAAKPDALFMHCLPAYAGKEVTQEVLDDPRSIIFDQAENRLHMQKAILAFLAKAAKSKR
jgi:ornithine carbamoyltransferase